MKYFKIVISILSVSLLTSVSFAKNKADLKFINVIEDTFGKPVVTSTTKNANGKEFNHRSFKKKTTKEGRKNYISNYFKLQDMNIIEIADEVHIVKSRDSIQMHIPVFKETVPANTREQMIVLIKKIPKNLKHVDRTLRSLYSKNGDLRVSNDGTKIVISDWTSNVDKIVKVIEAM